VSDDVSKFMTMLETFPNYTDTKMQGNKEAYISLKNSWNNHGGGSILDDIKVSTHNQETVKTPLRE